MAVSLEFLLVLVFSISGEGHARNCTNSFYVSQSAGTVKSNCVDFTNQSNRTKCVPFSDFLREFGRLECDLKLLFRPGRYVLTSYNILVNTSLTMSALVDSEVVITCSNSERRDYSEISTTIWVNLGDSHDQTGYTNLSGIIFEDCVFQMRIDYVETLSVNKCIFRGFSSPALDVFNSLHVAITDSSFIGNNVSTYNERFRADSAGLAVAYNLHQFPSSNPTLELEQCQFINNIASISSDQSNQINNALNNNTYPARGGGLAIIISEAYANVSVSIKDSIFMKNYAKSFGGAFFLFVQGDGTNHSISISNTKFILNSCDGAGGAAVIGYVSDNFQGYPTKTDFINVLFDRNFALTSGGVLIITQSTGNGNYAIFRSCNFTSNSASGEGAALVFGSFHRVQTRKLLRSSIIKECDFLNNTSNGGVVIAGFTNVEVHGTCSFVRNHGPTLKITGALVEIKGNTTFTSNEGDISGKAAMYITALGQIKVYANSSLKFINNTGSIGAAIRIELQQFPRVYTKLLGNPLCFLQYEKFTLPPNQWQENLISFHGNTAHLGSAIYASYFDFCSYNDGHEGEIFSVQNFKKWPIFDFGVNTNTYHTFQKSENYYVQTPAVVISNRSAYSQKVHLRPGKEHAFNLTGLDQFGSKTYFTARILDKDNSLLNTLSTKYINVSEYFEPPTNYSVIYEDKDVPILHFSPNLLAINPIRSVSTKYTISSRMAGQLVEREKVILIEVQNSYGEIYDVEEKTIHIEPCLPGYELRPSHYNPNMMTCECVGGAQKDSFAVLECHEEDESIHLRDGYWAGQRFTNHDFTKHLIVSTCPITYCQCEINNELGFCEIAYYYNDIDRQCYPPRQGPLCGSCSGNGSVISVLTFTCSSDCSSPDYALYPATAALVVIDSLVIVVVLILSIRFGLSLPDPLKPIIFYIQTVYIATEYFPISFWETRKTMLYLGNLLGLYFPVDFCFIQNVPTVLSFTTRFIPVIITIIIISIFFLSTKRARRGMWQGVWALVLLLYAPLVHTCVMLLKCPMIADNDGDNYVGRWFLDASIECFSDASHIVLGTFAIIFLVAMVMMILGIILLFLFEHSSLVQERYSFLIYVLKELKSGYNPKKYWMSSMELVKRLVLIGILVGCPGRTVLPIYVVTFLFVIHLYLLPYDSHICNVLEAVILLGYIILLVLRFCQTILDHLDSYTGLMVPSDSRNGLPYSLSVVSFFSTFFYAPFIVGLVVCIVLAVYKVWKCTGCKMLRNKIRWKAKTVEHENDLKDFDKCYYHGNNTVNSSGRVIPATSIGRSFRKW